MRITGIKAYRVELPLLEGGYSWSGGKSVQVFDSTVVAVETDEGLVGHGEACPLGPAYLPAYAEGVRAGIAELGPAPARRGPARAGRAERADGRRRCKGHPYVKSAIDMACWDILGQAAGLPVCTLLGGRYGEDFALYRAISQEAPDGDGGQGRGLPRRGLPQVPAQGRRRVEDDIARIRAVAAELEPGDGLVADANTGWTDARGGAVVCDAVRDVDVYIEQPCLTYEECLTIRRRTRPSPSSSTRSIDGMRMLVRGHADGAMDVINLKISKFGGLTRARQVRDLCVALGIAMTIEDSWGGDIVTAAIAHLAHSTPPEFLFSATDFNSYVTVAIAEGAPRRNGRGGSRRRRRRGWACGRSRRCWGSRRSRSDGGQPGDSRTASASPTANRTMAQKSAHPQEPRRPWAAIIIPAARIRPAWCIAPSGS